MDVDFSVLFVLLLFVNVNVAASQNIHQIKKRSMDIELCIGKKCIFKVKMENFTVFLLQIGLTFIPTRLLGQRSPLIWVPNLSPMWSSCRMTSVCGSVVRQRDVMSSFMKKRYVKWLQKPFLTYKKLFPKHLSLLRDDNEGYTGYLLYHFIVVS